MTDFIEIPASKKSLSFRRLIHGVGINDADYMTNPEINGKTITCPYYRAWSAMIQRAYSDRYHKVRPTYIGCSVVKEWRVFSNFRDWMEKQDWQGKQLDKDILIADNKEYSQNACIFVNQPINCLLTDSAAARGELPQGVLLRRDSGKYRARCSVNGKKRSIGQFNTIPEAEYAYLTFKSELIRKTAHEEEAANNPKLQLPART